MIGNDVVDLRLSRSQSNWERKGFLEKVFVPSEQQVIRKATDKHQAVWLMWSMKEAAYKAHQRRYSLPRRLNWRMLECRIHSVSGPGFEGVVTIEGVCYSCFSRTTADLVYTIAKSQKNLRVKSRLLKAGSLEVRGTFLAEMAMLLGHPQKDISLVKDDQGVPYIYLRDSRFHSPFSLTSHGRFAAFSVPLTNC